jgi:hypothetical protein
MSTNKFEHETKVPMTSDMEQKAREIAYRLWEEAGHPDGQHEIHWQRAVEMVAMEAPAPDDLKGRRDAGKDKLRVVESGKPGNRSKVA